MSTPETTAFDVQTAAGDLITLIDQARSVLNLASAVLIEGKVHSGDTACALDLVSDVLQRVRDGLDQIHAAAEPR